MEKIIQLMKYAFVDVGGLEAQVPVNFWLEVHVIIIIFFEFV